MIWGGRGQALPLAALAGGGADGSLEGPASNVVDLFLHGAGQRHDAHRYAEQIVFGDVTVGQFGLGQRRDHALLDFRPSPADGEFGQLGEVETRRIDAAAVEVDLEDFDALVVERQVHEEDFIEAALADHFGGQQVDAIGGSCHEQAAGFFLHPGEEEGEDTALLAARFGGGNAHLNFVEPQDGGRHVFEHLAGGHEGSFGLAVAAGEDLDHVDAVERQLEIRSNGFHRKALAAAGNTHHQQSLGRDICAEGVAHLKEFAAFDQPLLQAFETADLAHVASLGDEFDGAAAVHQQALLFEHGRDGCRAKFGTGVQRPAQRVAGFVEREPLQGARQLVQVGVARIGENAGWRRFGQFFTQEVDQFHQVGRAKFNEQEAALDLFRDGADGRTDDDELTPVEATFVQIAEATPDLGRIAQGLVKILEVEDGGIFVSGDKIERGARGFRSGLGALAVAVEPFGQAPDPYRACRVRTHFAQDAGDALLFGRADIREWTSGIENVAQRPGRTAFVSGTCRQMFGRHGGWRTPPLYGAELWGGRPPWQEEINPSASGRQLPYRPFREKLRQAGAGRLDRRALRISTAAPPSTSGVCSPPWRPT